MKRLKAYQVRDDYEGHSCIQFAINNATARREGANELNIEWEEVETCRREPQFDQYAPGPVPPSVLIEHGWWFECWHCGEQVDEYTETEIVYEGSRVYCCMGCRQAAYAKSRRRQAAHAALIEVFESKYPDCTIKHVHVYDDELLPPAKIGGAMSSVSFMFPGAKYGATFVYGDDHLLVAHGDLPEYYAWRGIEPPEATDNARAA